MQYGNSLLEKIRRAQLFVRTTAMTIIVCYMSVFYSPTALAYKEMLGNDKVSYSDAQQLMNSLMELQTDNYRYLRYSQAPSNQLAAAKIYQSRLKDLNDKLLEQKQAAQRQIQSQLNQAVKLNDKAEIDLQGKRLAALHQHYRPLQLTIDSILATQVSKQQPLISAAKKLEKQLNSIKFGKAHHQYDNDNMPFGPLSSTVYKPAQNLNQLLGNLQLADDKAQVNEANVQGSVSLAEQVDYLEQNIDTQSSEALTALAQSLNHEPVQIFQYVYNNIEYVPAHGSIQGADYTRASKRGGAMDQASLLVGLLRLANVPARYVYGSVTVDIEQGQNWVGGATTPEAVQNILGQGGVPNTLVLNQQGQVQWLNLEHVWVEAQINDQWQPLDPSFKQYQFTDGIDVSDLEVLDGNQLITSMMAGSSSNEEEGWVQTIDKAAIEQQFTDIQAQVEQYINDKYPNASAADIMTQKNVIVDNSPQLPSALPYQNIIASQSLKDLPDNLRHKFGFQLQDIYGSTYLNVERSLPELAGKRLGLSFTPATQADEQAMLALLPDTLPDDTDPQLPDVINYNAYSVVANILINEQVVEQSSSYFAIGQELNTRKGFWDPRFGWDKSDSAVIAGEYQAIGLDFHGVSSEQMIAIEDQLEQAKANLANDNYEAVTLDNTTGMMLQAGVASYFAATAQRAEMVATISDVINYRQPSYGTFSTTLSVSYFFGVPSKVHFFGVTMDIDRLAGNAESKSNCWDDWRDYNRSAGNIASYLENIIPERLFNTAEQTNDGISAVKALELAAYQGQKIYTLKQSNMTQLSNINIDLGARQEIQNALNSGKVVTVHEQPLNTDGWVGSGYIITDPDTGSGAYKISGGAGGGALKTKINKLMFWGGALQGLLKNNIVAKAIAKTLGQIVTVFTNAYKFITECSSLSIALILTLVFTLISVAIAIALFFVASPFATILSFGIGYLEGKLADLVIGYGC